MTPFALLASLAGLSHREAGDFLSVRPDTVQSWAIGRRECPPGPLDELRGLIARQKKAADEALQLVVQNAPDEIELGFPAGDSEARDLGWPCVGAWGAMAARFIAACPARVRLVPRGSTPATAAARSV
jgi:hypothetical protein